MRTFSAGFAIEEAGPGEIGQPLRLTIGVQDAVPDVIFEASEFVEDERPAAEDPDGLPIVQSGGPADALGGAGNADGLELVGPEIGRASCRERVLYTV